MIFLFSPEDNSAFGKGSAHGILTSATHMLCNILFSISAHIYVEVAQKIFSVFKS